MTNESRITRHPSHASGGIALLGAFCATGLSTSGQLQLTVVVLEAIGAFVLLGSSVARQQGKRASGLALLLAGSLLVSTALGLGAVFPVGPIERGALLGGLLGPVLVLLAVYPLWAPWSRLLAGLGTALLVCGVVVRGWLGPIGRIQLFGAVMLTILAWDAAERAITLGNDVGRGARTFVVSITHTIGSVAIGTVAIIVTIGAYRVAPETIPLGGAALLLGSIPVLLLSLYLSYLR